MTFLAAKPHCRIQKKDELLAHQTKGLQSSFTLKSLFLLRYTLSFT